MEVTWRILILSQNIIKIFHAYSNMQGAVGRRQDADLFDVLSNLS